MAGLGRGAAEEFPGPEDEDFRKGRAYAEEWAAVETRHATLGVVGNRDMEEIEWGWGMNSLTRFYDCPPQSRAQPAPLHIYAGDGDWRTVRQILQRLTGQSIRLHEAVPEPRAPLGARIDPPVAATTGEAVDVTLLVEHLLARKFTGTAQLVLPEGWQAEATELELRDVAWQHPHRTNLHLTTNAQPGASVARLAIRSPEFDGDFDLPLLRLGDGSTVAVHEAEREGQRVLTIDNGHMELEVTPRFAATLSALRAGGADHLASPFPRVATLGWMSPWYGGVMPIVMPGGEWNFPGRLWQESFEAEPVDHRDGRGIAWQGVRQRATLTKENLRGLQVEIDSLTVGGSPVVKHVLRVINTTSVARHLETVGFAIFVQPDGSRARTTLWGPDRQRKHSDRMAFIKTGHWAAAQNPDTERAIALVSPLPEVSMAGMGSEGGHFELMTHWSVPANGMIEVVAFLVLTDDIDSARRFEALKDLA